MYEIGFGLSSSSADFLQQLNFIMNYMNLAVKMFEYFETEHYPHRIPKGKVVYIFISATYIIQPFNNFECTSQTLKVIEIFCFNSFYLLFIDS